MNLKPFNTKGAIALTTMVVFGSIITMVIVSIVLLGLSSRLNAFNSIQSELSFIRAEGCMEEALIQLSRDDTYTGDVYSVDGSICTVVIEGTGDERMLELAAEDGYYYHDFTLLVKISPEFAILDFSY